MFRRSGIRLAHSFHPTLATPPLPPQTFPTSSMGSLKRCMLTFKPEQQKTSREASVYLGHPATRKRLHYEEWRRRLAG